MTLEDLKTQWEALDHKLESALQLTLRTRRETVLGQIGGTLRGLTTGAVVEAALGLAASAWLVQFMGSAYPDLRFLLPAWVLLMFVGFQTVFNIYQWQTVTRVDPSEPVLEVQRRLALLGARRVRVTAWTLLLAPLLWVPLLLVLLRGLFGIDGYALFSPVWLLVNALFGAAVIPLMLWLARATRDRWQRWPWLQALLDDIAGRSLKRSLARLDELAEFERQS